VARVAHPVLAYGMRIEHEGRVFAYSGDTGPCAALDRVAKGADLFLCEAAFHVGRDSDRDLHLNGHEAAEAASRAGARSLLLTHVPPWNDPERTLAEATPAFRGPIQLARPGLVVEID
ncbi:MAG TPA: MBL fold metallo-hydrolase, partial [Actinomycetes bacterium]|nr:MBL fold metallo-hydrolase [Actinomycetes bacterium]